MNGKFTVVVSSLFAIALFSISCTTGSYQDGSANHEPIHDRMMKMAEQYEGPLRNPVIIIHGLLGAKISGRDNKILWGNFSPREIASGTNFRELAIPMKKGVPLPQLKNGTRPSGLLNQSEIRILGVQFALDNYDILVNSLIKAGYTPESKVLPPDKHYPTLFVFYYDWRRDISENSAELHRFIKEKKEFLSERYKAVYGEQNRYDIQFDLVGHSMGGLLARYYLRYGGKILPDEPCTLEKPDWSGADHVDKVIVIGTPNAGYADTLLELKNGLRLVSGIPAYPPALLGTFLSYYEMLPAPESKMIRKKSTGQSIDLFDIEVWKKYQWGLADPKQDQWLKDLLPEINTKEERREIALDHLQKSLVKAKLFREALAVNAEGYPPDISVWLIAGNTVETNALLEVDETGYVTVAERTAGDGKVTFSSCCQDSRAGGVWHPYMVTPVNWKAIYPVPGGHMGIMNTPFFDTVLRHILLDIRNPDNEKKRSRNHL